MEIVFDASSSMCPRKLRNPGTILYRDVWSCEVSVLAKLQSYSKIIPDILLVIIVFSCWSIRLLPVSAPENDKMSI